MTPKFVGAFEVGLPAIGAVGTFVEGKCVDGALEVGFFVVGRIVERTVGVSEGLSVTGNSVGLSEVGFSEGLSVGISVGDSVGVPMFITVGLCVGVSVVGLSVVGDSVGAFVVGNSVGVSVFGDIGLNVGISVIGVIVGLSVVGISVVGYSVGVSVVGYSVVGYSVGVSVVVGPDDVKREIMKKTENIRRIMSISKSCFHRFTPLNFFHVSIFIYVVPSGSLNNFIVKRQSIFFN